MGRWTNDEARTTLPPPPRLSTLTSDNLTIDESSSTRPPPRSSALSSSTGHQSVTAQLARDRNYARLLEATEMAERVPEPPDRNMPWADKGILLRVWKGSSSEPQSENHVVIGSFSQNGRFMKNVMDFKLDGTDIAPGQRNGTGSVAIEAVDYRGKISRLV
ncbi:MAG: hypothetical protein M1816_007510 [Peltula sp. TS41687]|nr:MAG: hypothetical protein M1816_007510 [Peltula sp. TS41687]